MHLWFWNLFFLQWIVFFLINDISDCQTKLSFVIVGNQAILDDIHSNIDFSYVRILKMMYSMDPDVRLLAGLALATFAYNNVNQQKEIADQGGVRFNCFCPFLQSEDEYYRCLAAFQVKMLFQYLTNASGRSRDNIHSQTRVTAIKLDQLTFMIIQVSISPYTVKQGYSKAPEMSSSDLMQQ